MAAAASGGALAAPLIAGFASTMSGAKLRLRIRHDLVPDTLMNAVLGLFNSKDKDISVVSDYRQPEQTWDEELLSIDAVPAKLADGDYDLFLVYSSNLARMVDRGMVEPLDGYLAAGGLNAADFHRSAHSGVLDSAVYRGKVWALPIAADPYAMFCNHALFERAGLKPPLKTWGETLAAARKMTADTGGAAGPDVFGYSQCSFQFPLQILSEGLELVDMDRKTVTFDSDAGAEALELYRELNACSPNHIEFERGDIGMKISITSNAFGRYSHLRYSVERMPEGRIRVNSYGGADGALVLGIRAGKPETAAAAFRFAEWLLSEKTYFRLTKWLRSLPVRKSILEGERFKRHLEQYPRLKPFVEEMNYAKHKPCIPEYRFLHKIMREVLLPVQTEPPQLTTRAQIRDFLARQAELCNERLAKAEW